MNNRKKILMSISACNKNNHAYVDLGLPSGTKWATCNIGATNPEDTGLYFAWGETEGFTADQVTGGDHSFNWKSYKYANSSADILKYNTVSSRGTVDNKTTLDLEDDAARVNCGGEWKMPTQKEIQELISNCNYKAETLNGVKGCRLTSKINGNSIFIPFTGYCNDSGFNGVSNYARLWSSSLFSSNPANAYYLYCDSDGFYLSFINRYCGFAVRAVL